MNLGLKGSGGTQHPATPAFDATGGSRDPRFVFLTSQAACDLLGYTGRWRLRSLYRWLDANGVPKCYRSPRRFLLRLSDVVAVLKRGGVSHAKQSERSAVSVSTSPEEVASCS